MTSQTRIFSQAVGDHMGPTPPCLAGDASVAELLGALARAKATCALVTDEAGRLAGIVTERDVARRIALRCQGGEPVRSVMSEPVHAVEAGDYLDAAQDRLARHAQGPIQIDQPDRAAIAVDHRHVPPAEAAHARDREV